MRTLHSHISACAVTLGLLVLAACGGVTPAVPLSETETVPSPIDRAKQLLSIDVLSSLSYTVTDPTLRSLLSASEKDFLVRLDDGTHRFPPTALMGPYSVLTLDVPHVTYGDLTGDGVVDAVVPLRAGDGENAIVELAVVTWKDGAPSHVASFPLRHAQLRDVRVYGNSIRVRYLQPIPGDPGPSNAELVLSLPSGSGAHSE